ncbi:Heme chaperone HemW [Commensalibacter sp. Nvir]|uniref:radical SAM family heme chaperone HemW n=1 Tax=Commensalibacter sp. Nvir TaxID=3069817 RepID=UPI002D3212E6|nr:Heme chaperone HemW [Commensalibacter sp. Nvir]
MFQTSNCKQRLALYVHWPFCLSKCPYCDFNSYVNLSISQELYAKALCLELENALKNVKGRTLTSIFFGGGTPSLMNVTTVEKIISLADQYVSFSDHLEVTLEANPTSVEIQKFKDFKHAGITRLSLGIQSLDPLALKKLGRTHSVYEAIQALALAKNVFNKTSFDLIYAREGQNLCEWEKELKRALSLADDHLSLYQLTIEPQTLFTKKLQQGQLRLPSEKSSRDMMLLTDQIMSQHNLEAYEISNYAKKNSKCKHNLMYWHYEDYIGIGPGAHGRIYINNELHATECYRNPKEWFNNVLRKGHGLVSDEPLSSQEKAYEMLLMGLRLKEGIQREWFQKRCTMDILDCVNIHNLNSLVKEHYLYWDCKTLKTTQKGKLCLNTILTSLLS